MYRCMWRGGAVGCFRLVAVVQYELANDRFG